MFTLTAWPESRPDEKYLWAFPNTPRGFDLALSAIAEVAYNGMPYMFEDLSQPSPSGVRG